MVEAIQKEEVEGWDYVSANIHLRREEKDEEEEEEG